MQPINELRSELIRISLSGQADGFITVMQLMKRCKIDVPDGVKYTFGTDGPSNMELANNLLPYINAEIKLKRKAFIYEVLAPTVGIPLLVAVAMAMAVGLFFAISEGASALIPLRENGAAADVLLAMLIGVCGMWAIVFVWSTITYYLKHWNK